MYAKVEGWRTPEVQRSKGLYVETCSCLRQHAKEYSLLGCIHAATPTRTLTPRRRSSGLSAWNAPWCLRIFQRAMVLSKQMSGGARLKLTDSKSGNSGMGKKPLLRGVRITCFKTEPVISSGYQTWDIGAGDTGGTCPHFSKSRAKCPFSCNLVALLEDPEVAKISSKTHASRDFRGSKFHNLPVEHAPRAPQLIYI